MSADNEQDLGPVLTRGSDIKPIAIRWLWDGWLAEGALHVLAGAPGTGKTTLALSLAAAITSGRTWPDRSAAPLGDVLIWSGEDAANTTLVPRLMAMGANMQCVYFVEGTRDGEGVRSFDPATDLALLHAKIHALGLKPKLLIVDPIVSAVAGDSNKNAETRRALQPLVDLAKIEGCAVLGISHFSKGSSGREVTERVTGSLAFGAVARVVMAAAKRNDEQGGGRLFCRAKSNLGPDDGGFVYELESADVEGHEGVTASRVAWGEVLDGAARELLALAEQPEENRTERDAAKEWLADLLRDGPMVVGEVKRAQTRDGYHWRTVERAASDIGVHKKREGFGPNLRSTWSLAPLPPAPEHSRQPKLVAGLAFRGANDATEVGEL